MEKTYDRSFYEGMRKLYPNLYENESKNDRIIKETFFSADTVKYILYYNSDNYVQAIEKYNEEGKKLYIEYYNLNGKRTGLYHFKPTPKGDPQYNANVNFHGNYFLFYEDGRVKEKGKYRNGVVADTIFRYNKDGHLIEIEKIQ